MGLKLNLPNEYIKLLDELSIPFYKEYFGKNVDQMPKLIADGRFPMNVAQLMQRRLDVRNSDDELKITYMDNYFDTGDAVVYHPDGRVKIVLDSQTLRDMIPKSEKNNGVLILMNDIYDSLQGEEFKKEKLGKVNEYLTREDVKAHPVWKVLARDQVLLNDYADYIFAEGKKRFGYDAAMEVYLDMAGNDVKMRAWYLNRLVDRSGAGGGYYIGYDYGRLIGIAPGALSVPGKNDSNIKAYTMADLQAFDNYIKRLENIISLGLLEPIKELRKKL